MTIWKFPLKEITAQQIMMPVGAKVLCLQTQNGKPFLWAVVDASPVAIKSPRYFVTVGTGHELPGGLGGYIGTYQLEGGALVFHVFEGKPL